MTSLGVIEGLAELTASLLKVKIGIKSDQIGKRRPFVWVGYLISTLSKASIGLASSWLGVLISRVLDRVGKGIRTAPRDALIAESVPQEQLGLAFGIHRGMDTLGAVLGPILALVLLSHWGSEHLRDFYFLAVIPGMIAVFLAMTLPESIQIVLKNQGMKRGSFKELPKSFFGFMISWCLFSLANSSDAFLILKTKSMGYSLSETILMYCLYNLVYAISSPLLGGLSDRIGKKRILQISLLVFSVVYFGFGFQFNPWVLFCFYGLFMGMSEGIGKALVAEFVPKEKMSELGATAQGFFGMATGISALIASLAAGLLWDQVGSSAPFFLGGIGAILALIVFLILG